MFAEEGRGILPSGQESDLDGRVVLSVLLVDIGLVLEQLRDDGEGALGAEGLGGHDVEGSLARSVVHDVRLVTVLQRLLHTLQVLLVDRNTQLLGRHDDEGER